MTLTEFNQWLKKQPICDKLVSLRYKYGNDEYWFYSNEILSVDMEYPTLYVWLNDWNEGQEDIEILGCIDIDEIEVPDFDEL